MLIEKEVADFIIYLIKSYQDMEHLFNNTLPDYSIKGSSKYLLRQLIRQINIPHSNMYVSERALNLWKKITNDNIKNKCYTDQVVCKIDNWEHPKYVGASKTASIVTTNRGETFKYNDVFLDEHIVPVELIIRELLKIDTSRQDVYDQIDSVLQDLTVCKLLKEENPKTKFKRCFNLNEVLQTDYSHIKIYCFNEIDEFGEIIKMGKHMI